MAAGINLQNPFEARRWLQLLVEDEGSGFRLKPDLDVPADRVGFSVRANHLGLLGPANEAASNVIVGTSFAMGIGVDYSEAWYQHHLDPTAWLNLAIPLGITEWQYLLRRHHHGDRDLLLVLYHPNIWQCCVLSERWRNSGKSLFAAANWKTSWPQCAWLSAARKLRVFRERRRGQWLIVDHMGQRYEVDARYAYVDPVQFRELIATNLTRLGEMLRTFRRSLIIRLPVKQQLVPARYRSAILNSTIDNFDMLWRATKDEFVSEKNVHFFEPNVFTLEHFHPCDTHWNTAGHEAFAKWLHQIL